MTSKLIACIAGLFILAAPATAAAQTTVASSRASHVGQTGSMYSTTTNGNTFTGRTSSEDHRSFIEFAVPASATPFTSAVLRLDAGSVPGGPNDLTVHDFDSTIGVTPGTDIYADAGTGVVFGTVVGLNTANQTFDITLNAAGLAAVNAARGGNVVFGFTSAPTTGDPDGVFGATDMFTTRQLILSPTAVAPAPVPTLSEWAMILLAVLLAGGAALMIQRRQTA